MKTLGLGFACMLVSLTICSLAVGQRSADLAGVRHFFSSIAGGPYVYLQGANTDMTVGTLMAVVDNTQFFVRRPQSCFTEKFLKSSSQSGSVSTLQINQTSHLDIGAGLKAASLGPVTSDVKAELDHKGAKSIDITYGTLTRTALPIDDLKNEILNDMDSDCRASFLSTKGSRYIIVETLSATSFSIAFTDSSGHNVSIAATIFKTLFPSFQSTGDSEVKGTQKIDTT